MTQISAVICAKAEGASLYRTISEVSTKTDEVVVVIAPGDTCNLLELKRRYPKIECNKIRILFDSGKGKGEAVRLGIHKSRGKVIVLLDADGSHRTADIPKLVKPILKNEADMVLASRGRGGSDELHGTVEKMIRLIGSSIITVIINLRFGVELTDTQNGFRAISRVAAMRLLLTDDSFAIEQEMVMKALKHKLLIYEIPSHEYARVSGKSRINLWAMTPKYAWGLLKNLL